MPQTKIQGKFYPLTFDVTTKLRQAKLTAAEWRIWSYLVEIDPWGDRYRDIDSLDVMSKCDCSRATFYRAIAKFQKLKIFDIQDKGFSIRNLTGASSLKSSQAEEQSTKPTQANLKNEKVVSKMRLDSQNCENRPPESPPDKVFKLSQTLQTYLDFKQTLSKSERENFFDFVRKKTENLEKPINDLEAWLASKNSAKRNRWEVYYEIYQQEKIGQNRKPTRQENKSGSLSPSQVQRAIAEFKRQRGINQPLDEPESESVNTEEDRQREAEFNRLLDNPPEYEVRKSPAQQRREAIAEARRKQEKWNLERKRLDAERQRQQEMDEPDPEERTARMIRETEEFLRNRQQQNPEIEEEGKDYE